MRTLLEAAIIALGAWLCLSPLALGYAEPIAIALSVGMGVLSVVCACIGLRSKTVQINFMVLVAAGLCFAVWGLVGSLGLAWINGVNEVIVGLLIPAFRPSACHCSLMSKRRASTTEADRILPA